MDITFTEAARQVLIEVLNDAADNNDEQYGASTQQLHDLVSHIEVADVIRFGE